MDVARKIKDADHTVHCHNSLGLAAAGSLLRRAPRADEEVRVVEKHEDTSRCGMTLCREVDGGVRCTTVVVVLEGGGGGGCFEMTLWSVRRRECEGMETSSAEILRGGMRGRLSGLGEANAEGGVGGGELDRARARRCDEVEDRSLLLLLLSALLLLPPPPLSDDDDCW